MKYCSFETRKVLDCLEEYGIALPERHYYFVEIAVGRYWNTHVQQVCRQFLEGGNVEKKLEKIEQQGWLYFKDPLEKILLPRGAAHRGEQITWDDPGGLAAWAYDLVTSSLLLCDFNMQELRVLMVDIPPMCGEPTHVFNAIEAAKRQNIRTIAYLHGILRREYQTRQGKLREIQSESAKHDTGWTPGEFEQMDVIERKEILADWKDRLNNIKINKALNALRED